MEDNYLPKNINLKRTTLRLPKRNCVCTESALNNQFCGIKLETLKLETELNLPQFYVHALTECKTNDF